MMDPSGLGQVWQVKQSQLYALLNRLEEEGYVSTELEFQDSRPPRKMFALTTEGHATFQTWITQPVKHGRDMRLDFLVKLHFARQVGENVAQNLVDSQRIICQSWQDERENSPQGSFEWLIDEFRRGQIDAMLTWLEECELFIRSNK